MINSSETYRVSAKTDLMVAAKMIANMKRNIDMVFLAVILLILHLFYFALGQTDFIVDRFYDLNFCKCHGGGLLNLIKGWNYVLFISIISMNVKYKRLSGHYVAFL
jgi:hypothetical protein